MEIKYEGRERFSSREKDANLSLNALKGCNASAREGSTAHLFR